MGQVTRESLFREFCGGKPKLTKAQAAKLERQRTHSFVACKKAIDGSHRQWGHVFDLTHDEARDPVRFPLGKQSEGGQDFVWVYYNHLAARGTL